MVFTKLLIFYYFLFRYTHSNAIARNWRLVFRNLYLFVAFFTNAVPALCAFNEVLRDCLYPCEIAVEKELIAINDSFREKQKWAHGNIRSTEFANEKYFRSSVDEPSPGTINDI